MSTVTKIKLHRYFYIIHGLLGSYPDEAKQKIEKEEQKERMKGRVRGIVWRLPSIWQFLMKNQWWILIKIIFNSCRWLVSVWLYMKMLTFSESLHCTNVHIPTAATSALIVFIWLTVRILPKCYHRIFVKLRPDINPIKCLWQCVFKL